MRRLQVLSAILVVFGTMSYRPLSGNTQTSSGAMSRDALLPPGVPQSPAAPPVTRAVDCNRGEKIQDAIDAAKPGDQILASGTCHENLRIEEFNQNLTIDGQGVAAISCLDPSGNGVLVRGRGINLKGFTIAGCTNGIIFVEGGTAVIDANIIELNSNGIVVSRVSYARIVNNTIRNNSADGISLNDLSGARIGFSANNDTTASPNTIILNGGAGIRIVRSSNGRIVGNTISNNSGGGIVVSRVPSADISSNTINSNTGDGILVTQNSGVNLGSDSGSGIFSAPNSTTSNNTGAGIRCRINSYADGRLGTLNGGLGATNVDTSVGTPNGGCVDSLM